MALTTVPDKTAGDLFTEAMWDTYIKDNINELIGRTGGGNLLVNGGMEICQRGAGPFNGGGTAVVGLDCWKGNRTNVAGTSQVAMSQDATTVDTTNSLYAMKCVITYTAITSEVYQRVEDFYGARNKTHTFAIRINQPVASYITPFFRVDGVKTYGTASATTGSWVTLTQTMALGTIASSLEVGVEFSTSGQTCYLDNATLAVGTTAVGYVNRHPQEELARCQRYYEVLGGVTDSVVMRAYAAASAGISMTVFFKVTKGGTPTVTKNGTWAVTNCGQPAVGGASVGSCYLTATATATADTLFSPNSSDDTLTVEFNP